MALLWLPILGQTILVLRLFAQRLAGKYPAFVFFLLASVASELVPFFVPHTTHLYTYIWLTFEPLLVILRLIVVYEAYRLFVAAYPGLDKAAPSVFALQIISAAVISIALLPIEIPDVAQGQWLVTAYNCVLVIKRVVCLQAALFIAFLALWHLRFYVPIPRNLTIHGIILTIYLTFNAAESFMAVQKGTPWVVQYVLPASFLLTIAWAFAYSRYGETVRREPVTAEDLANIEQAPEMVEGMVDLAATVQRARNVVH